MAKRTRSSGRQVGRKPAPKVGLRPNRPTSSAASTGSAPARDGIERIGPPLGRPSTEPTTDLEDMPATSFGHLTDLEVKRAEVLEAQAMAREREAIAESLRRKASARAIVPNTLSEVNAPLSVRAAHEYAYVARDVRRIVLTGALMVAILAVLDVLVNVLGVVTF